MYHKPLKIVHIVEAFSGGVNTYLRMVLPRLAAEGFNITLICSFNRSCPHRRQTISELKKSGVKIYVVPMTREINLVKDIRSLVMLYKLLSQRKYDIIHTHCSKAGALGRIAACLTGIKFVCHTPHCFAYIRCDDKLRRLLYLYLERLLGLITTRLIAVSKSEFTAAVNSYVIAPSKCMVVHNALEVKPKLKKNRDVVNNLLKENPHEIIDNKLIIVTVCSLVNYKGIFQFLQAARLSSHPHALFLIAGDGEQKNSVNDFIVQCNLQHKVKLLGHVKNIESVYAVADVVVLCSKGEGQPYSLLEAMRAQKPIVATRVPGNCDLVIPHQTGCLVELKPENIARAIDSLLKNPSRRRRFGENAYKYFRKYHVLKTQIRKLSKIYRACMSDYQNECYAKV